MYISDTKVYYDKLIEHDLSLIEYCVADYIYKLANTPGNKKDGCYMSKENIAKALSIGIATLYRIIIKLRSKSLLTKDDNCLQIINWEPDGNFYFIRHNLIKELKTDDTLKRGGIVLSIEEYAIMDIALNQPKITQKEIQRRINCSKRSLENYIKKINRNPAMCYINGGFIIRDIYLRHYFDTDTKKILDQQQQSYGKLAKFLFDENGNKLP